MLPRDYLQNFHFEMEANAQTSEVLSVLNAFVVFVDSIFMPLFANALFNHTVPCVCRTPKIKNQNYHHTLGLAGVLLNATEERKDQKYYHSF